MRSYNKERKKYAKITVTLVLLHSNGDTRCLYPLKKNNSGYIYEFKWLRDAYPLRLRTLEKYATSNLELINLLNGKLYLQKISMIL